MTQIFDADGTVHPATVIKAGPCVVIQAKNTQSDGYEAVQLAFVEERPVKAGKPLAGHYKKAGVPPTRVRREVKVAAGGEALKLGDQVLVSIFADGERVDVLGTGKGKGFQGVVRRHHFAGGAATHGSMFHRAPGSIGASSFPSRVVKGMRAAGRMGGRGVTIRNVKVLRVDPEAHQVWVDGAETALTALEFRLLHTLLSRRGRVQTRSQLLEDVWGVHADVTTRTVDTHVKRLREKLGDAGNYIETVRGVGYRFTDTPEEVAAP
jgi:large subunit ribosomal protein L3